MLTKSFRTADLALAAFLKSKGFKIHSIDRSRGDGKCTFIFESTPEIDSIVLKFFNNECLVEPLQFLEETRRVKALIYRDEHPDRNS
jgi:hypothetical protein